ncbi:MAG: cupin protein [Acidobacteriaceae bacterium]|nr:cupin protein [Acidobacteriaceae bacterium]
MTNTKNASSVADPATTVAPQLVSQVEDAPGRGILPKISLHLAGESQLFHLDAQPVETINDLLSRQYLQETNVAFVKWIAKKGGVVPLTHHINEQVTWIIEGHAEVYSQGRKYIMKAGDIMIIPPNVPHEFIFVEDTIDIDIFAPGRQNWLDGTATYLRQK